MGIKGLFTFLRRWEQQVKIEEYVNGKSVGIDLFGAIYESKGVIDVVQQFLYPFIQYARAVHVVMDGTYATQERRAVLEERRAHREHIRQTMKEVRLIENMDESTQLVLDNYLKELERQAWKPSREYIDQIKSWCATKSIHIHEPMGEADLVLIDLEQNNTIDLIVTNDSDLIALGAECVLRDDKLFSKVHLRIQLGLTQPQWDDFMYLCRHMKESDVLLAYSLIRVYKRVGTVVSRWREIHKNELL